MKTSIIFLLVFFLGSTMAIAYTLPLPDNTVKEEADETQAEANNTRFDLAVYRSRLPAQEILSFYKENLAKAGFRLLTEDKKAKYLYFANPESDERFFILADDTIGDEVYIRVSHWYGNPPDYRDFLSEGGKKDMLGKDLAGIPRYPGAVRLSSLEYGGMQTASYKSDDRKEAIVSFYESRMISSGWKKLSTADSGRRKAVELLRMPGNTNEGATLYFEKKGRFLSILVQEACCGQKGRAISIVEISGVD
jgi:hypothetical protein